MKNWWPLVLAATVSLGACTKKDVDPMQPKIGTSEAGAEKLATVSERALQERDEAVQELREEMSAIKDNIKLLRERALTASGDARNQLDQQVRNLEREQRQLEAQFNRMQAAVGARWHELRQSVRASLQELREAIEKVRISDDSA